MTIITRNTQLIQPESGDYPLYLSDVVQRIENICLPPNVDSELLKELGFEVVNDSDRPSADVVTEGKPAKTNGEWYKTWETREYNEEERQTSFKAKQDNQRARITNFQNQEFAKGFPYEFEGTVYHIQTRFSDRSNIDSLHTMAEKMKAAGKEEAVFEFRTWENVSINLTPQQMIDLAEAAFVQVSAAYKRVWTFKDAVDEATSVEEFPEDYTTLFNQ